MPRTEPKIVANAIASRRKKTAIKLPSCLMKCFLAASFARLCRLGCMPSKALPRMTGAPYLTGFSRDVGFHSARTLSSRVPWKLEGRDLWNLTSREKPARYRALAGGTELDGEGRRRSARSGAAKHARCDSIRDQLPVDVGDGKREAGAGVEVRGDGNRGDGTKALTIRARCLAQRRCCVRGRIGHSTQDAGMSAVSAAADGQQLLRCGERDHRRRRQQCSENAQQHERRNPPHAVSVHAPAVPGTAAVFAV